MTIPKLTRYEEYNQSHEEAIARIEEMTTDEKFGPFATWLVETTHSSWGFYPAGWQNSTATASGMANLLGTIHHALYDDGDISFFVCPNMTPRFGFFNRNDWTDIDPVDAMGNSDYTTLVKKGISLGDDITFLDGPAEFIAAIEKYKLEWAERAFVRAISRNGFDFTYQYMDELYKPLAQQWLVENATKIENMTSMFNSTAQTKVQVMSTPTS